LVSGGHDVLETIILYPVIESPDPLTTPPVFWTEVFSRPDSKWFPIDPIRALVNKRKVFDPTALNLRPGGPRTKIENRMLYVLAFEEDGYARDVTRRYARQYGARVAKLQGGSKAPNAGGGGKGRLAWWDRVVNFLHRPFRLASTLFISYAYEKPYVVPASR
jgi:xeroderma pigmentosum group C-complementing protein